MEQTKIRLEEREFVFAMLKEISTTKYISNDQIIWCYKYVLHRYNHEGKKKILSKWLKLLYAIYINYRRFYAKTRNENTCQFGYS